MCSSDLGLELGWALQHDRPTVLLAPGLGWSAVAQAHYLAVFNEPEQAVLYLKDLL